MTTVGYVGLNNHHAQPYLKSLEALPVSVTCACEPDSDFDIDSIDSLGDVPIYRDPTTLLEKESPDAIWVTLPNRDTPSVIESAVTRGIDVFTEKSAARTAAELEPLIETVEEANAMVCVSSPWRGHPAAEELRDRAKEGLFGELRSVEARFLADQVAYRDTDHYLFDRNASRGGIVQWLGIHWIDLLPWILDDPIVRVNASLTYGATDIDVEDGAAVQFEFASGAIGTLQCGYYLLEDQYDTTISINGTDGQASWDPIGNYFGFDDETTVEFDSKQYESAGVPRKSISYEYVEIPGYGGGFGLEYMRKFLAAETTEEIPMPLKEMLPRLKVLDAVYESADSDGWVTV